MAGRQSRGRLALGGAGCHRHKGYSASYEIRTSAARDRGLAKPSPFPLTVLTFLIPSLTAVNVRRGKRRHLHYANQRSVKWKTSK